MGHSTNGSILFLNHRTIQKYISQNFYILTYCNLLYVQVMNTNGKAYENQFQKLTLNACVGAGLLNYV